MPLEGDSCDDCFSWLDSSEKDSILDTQLTSFYFSLCFRLVSRRPLPHLWVGPGTPLAVSDMRKETLNPGASFLYFINPSLLFLDSILFIFLPSCSCFLEFLQFHLDPVNDVPYNEAVNISFKTLLGFFPSLESRARCRGPVLEQALHVTVHLTARSLT